MNRHPTVSTGDASIVRMRSILDLGRWPSGLELTDEDRRLLEWNLDGAVKLRTERRKAEADRARTR